MLLSLVPSSHLPLIAPARSLADRFELKDDDHYRTFLNNVTARPEGVPLLTVSNHVSPLDDPGVLVGMLPASVTVKPNLMRWTLCAQEICFKQTSTQTGFGSAKVCFVQCWAWVHVGISCANDLNGMRRGLGGERRGGGLGEGGGGCTCDNA